ncbi:hypothetical protein MPSEU_000968000 [Mayamaea pseudoterrestris]|nr:hypothetical protein MPSEU_000968000 [Mayamaea pseudoterrestris]
MQQEQQDATATNDNDMNDDDMIDDNNVHTQPPPQDQQQHQQPPPPESLQPPESESLALQTILRNGSELDVSTFFESVYQRSCALFCANASDTMNGNGNFAMNGKTNNSISNAADDPYTSLIRNGWNVLLQLLEACRVQSEESVSLNDDDIDNIKQQQQPSFSQTLLFQNQSNLGPDALAEKYHHSLFAAYLDGCSIVINHAEILSEHLFALCHDLQHSLPHVYVNTYLTPPMVQSVPAHADDRDVLVVQLLGNKEWIVYEQVPVALPYRHEQVGKCESLPVPDYVLQGNVLLQTVLQPGDVLYLPRGYVHCAKACAAECSFHVTVALATHDWSYGRVVQKATKQLLSAQTKHRMALHRELGTRPLNQVSEQAKRELESMLDETWTQLQNQVTVQYIHETLQRTYREHNERAKWQRAQALQQQQQQQQQQDQECMSTDTAVVGRNAALRVRLDTLVRAASLSEKQSLYATTTTNSTNNGNNSLPSQDGLQVSNECYEALIYVLQKFKQNPRTCKVDQLQALCDNDDTGEDDSHASRTCRDYLCDLTWLALAKQCVELGAFAVVE